MPRKYQTIDVANSGDNLVFTPASGKKFRVLSIFLLVDGDVDITFKSGSNEISGAMPVGTRGGMVLPFSNYGWCQGVAADEVFNINLSAAVQCGGSVLVEEV